MSAWCRAGRIKIKFIQPERPNQNAFVEWFNLCYRRAVLGTYDTIEEVPSVTAEWGGDFNRDRAPGSSVPVAPDVLAAAGTLRESSYELSR